MACEDICSFGGYDYFNSINSFWLSNKNTSGPFIKKTELLDGWLKAVQPMPLFHLSGLNRPSEFILMSLER
jgi:hypothetical protein